MGVPGRTNVNHVDVVPADDVLPVSRIVLPTKMIGDSLYFGFIAAADHFQFRLVRDIEEAAYLSPCIAMRPPHETVADHRDVQFVHSFGFALKVDTRTWIGSVPPRGSGWVHSR